MSKSEQNEKRKEEEQRIEEARLRNINSKKEEMWKDKEIKETRRAGNYNTQVSRLSSGTTFPRKAFSWSPPTSPPQLFLL